MLVSGERLLTSTNEYQGKNAIRYQLLSQTRSGPKIPVVGHLEGRGFLGLNPFCKIKFFNGQILEVFMTMRGQM